MSNGEVCCILGVCCPAGSASQFEHLTEMIQKQRPHVTLAAAQAAASRVLVAHNNFDDIMGLIDEAPAIA
jgi:hypothetical protein